LSEIIGIVRAVGAAQTVTVIPCSEKAFEPQKVRKAVEVKNIDLPSDQSTDLRNGFIAAMSEPKKPKIIILVTDGYTEWPDSKPRGVDRVIILLTDDGALEEIPPWAKPIMLPAYTSTSDTTP